jgi:serine/threonine protein phosphatase PrpC
LAWQEKNLVKLTRPHTAVHLPATADVMIQKILDELSQMNPITEDDTKLLRQWFLAGSAHFVPANFTFTHQNYLVVSESAESKDPHSIHLINPRLSGDLVDLVKTEEALNLYLVDGMGHGSTGYQNGQILLHAIKALLKNESQITANRLDEMSKKLSDLFAEGLGTFQMIQMVDHPHRIHILGAHTCFYVHIQKGGQKIVTELLPGITQNLGAFPLNFFRLDKSLNYNEAFIFFSDGPLDLIHQETQTFISADTKIKMMKDFLTGYFSSQPNAGLMQEWDRFIAEHGYFTNDDCTFILISKR